MVVKLVIERLVVEIVVGQEHRQDLVLVTQ
jgi:hypothetical protein